MAVQADPAQRLEQIRQREREKKELVRQQNRDQHPELARFVDEAQALSARVTQLNGRGAETDDRVRCQDCAHALKLYRNVDFDGRKRRAEFDGCRVLDSGRVMDKPRRCELFVGR